MLLTVPQSTEMNSRRLIVPSRVAKPNTLWRGEEQKKLATMFASVKSESLGAQPGSPLVLKLVGWVERPRPLKRNLVKVEAKPIEAIAICDGFRKGSTILRAKAAGGVHCHVGLFDAVLG